MLIVLEGPDYSGKSTFAEFLVEAWCAGGEGRDGTVEHVGPPPKFDDNMTSQNWQWERYVELADALAVHKVNETNKLVVFDRFHWGMPVYGPLFRPEANFDGFGDLGKHKFFAVERMLQQHGALTVHIATPASELIKRSLSREDEYLDEQGGDRQGTLRAIWGRYMSFADRVGPWLPTFVGYPLALDVSTTNGTMAALSYEIQNYFARDPADDWSEFHTGTLDSPYQHGFPLVLPTVAAARELLERATDNNRKTRAMMGLLP